MRKALIAVAGLGALALFFCTVAVPAGAATPPMPDGVPASQVGKLLVNDNGSDLYNWQTQARGGASGSKSVSSKGYLYLHTTGASGNGYSIISPDTYTSGIFQARIRFQGDDGVVANWPAFWLSSAWSGATPWPQGGEMDLAEGMGGDLCVTYHYGPNGTPEQTPSKGITSTPGWHTVTGVWTRGKWQVYYNGTLVDTITGVVVNDPMNIILNNYQGTYGGPSASANIEVQYLRVWSLAG